MKQLPQTAALLKLTEDEYAEGVFNFAEIFLLRRTQGDHELAHSIMKQPSFWKWWESQWDRRNETLLKRYHIAPGITHLLHPVAQDFRLDHNHIHDPQKIDLQVNQHVFEDGYYQMISQVIEATNAARRTEKV